MIDEPLPIALPEDLLGVVIDGTVRAGEIAQRSYSEQDKWDLIAFGALLWRLTWNHVEDGLRDAGAKVWFEDNSLRFELEGFTCALYAGGHSPAWNVHTYDFTRTRKRGEAINAAQGQLFDVEAYDRDLNVNANELASLTFVYCGDPQLGTAALYLGAPIEQQGCHRWAWVRCLYRAPIDGDVINRNATYPAFDEQPSPDVVIEVHDEAREDASGTPS